VIRQAVIRAQGVFQRSAGASVAMFLAAAVVTGCCLPGTAQENVAQVAAKQFYQDGMQAAREHDFTRAAAKFSQAIKSDPTRPEYRAALSAAFVEQSQPQPAWEQIRLAMKSGAGDARIANQMFAVWNALGAEELFHAGTVQDTVRKALGKPDRVNQAGGKARWFYDFMAIDWSDGLLYSSIDLRGVEPALLRPVAQMVIRPDSRWRVRYRVVDRAQQTTHYFVPEAGPSSHEQFVMQRVFQLAEQGVAARQWMERMQRTALRTNPQIDWEIIEETDERLIYEWRQTAGDDWQARHEVALVLTDGRDLHHIAYSDQTEQLANDVRAAWLAQFQAASLRFVEPKSELIPQDSLAPVQE
jgi:hypothetical protein